jgi:hypothetical protein
MAKPQPSNADSENDQQPAPQDPAAERGEHMETAKAIARAGGQKGAVPGATPDDDASDKPDQRRSGS